MRFVGCLEVVFADDVCVGLDVSFGCVTLSLDEMRRFRSAGEAVGNFFAADWLFVLSNAGCFPLTGALRLGAFDDVGSVEEIVLSRGAK